MRCVTLGQGWTDSLSCISFLSFLGEISVYWTYLLVSFCSVCRHSEIINPCLYVFRFSILFYHIYCFLLFSASTHSPFRLMHVLTVASPSSLGTALQCIWGSMLERSSMNVQIVRPPSMSVQTSLNTKESTLEKNPTSMLSVDRLSDAALTLPNIK